MNAAGNALRLSLLIVVGLLFFIGQGWLIVGPILHGSLTSRRRETRLLQELPLALMSGLISNYGLLLAFQSLRNALAIGGVLSVLGLAFFSVFVANSHPHRRPTRNSVSPFIGAACLWLLFLSPVLAEPISAWDARSVWFFHAKMIYTAGSMGLAAGWLDPTAAFSNPGYPKLVPALAAQAAAVMGFWNEYIPKASLLFMLAPAVLWLFEFARRSLSFAMLILLLPFGLSTLQPLYGLFPWMWNGYMDGYLALYFAIALLLLGRYRQSSDAVDMLAAVCILLMLPGLKIEGALAAGCGLLIAAWLFIRRSRFKIAAIPVLANWKYAAAILVWLAPTALWAIYRQAWGLTGYLQLDVAETVARVASRVVDGTLGLILQGMWTSAQPAFLLAGLLLCAYLAWNRALPRKSLPALAAAGIHALLVVAIYLATPFEIDWHLETSMHRVILASMACLFVAAYYLLDDLESDASLGWMRADGGREPA